MTPNYDPTARFWLAVNGNFVDMCVLEWCKLFGDRKAQHHWSKVVREPEVFEKLFFDHFNVDQAEFQKTIDIMRQYRDHFVAHLDSERIMNVPSFDIPKRAVWFYYAYIVAHEEANTAGFPHDLDEGYKQTEDQAKRIYQAQNRPTGDLS